ncbi:hypothetical protein [Paraburkholderia caribensis]|uniref:hypothetical protein n=1 Tax=Paraburkholderia caribensis TaxID=75105 RepID=UPI001CB405BE|nr:hypothetical protein [Paraburkholderia caribensis]CAG9256141.1 hypothetical protein PCAR4_40230 [Paraburkholderia caribensis]
MNHENTEPDVVDLASYKASRAYQEKQFDGEVVTDVRFAITRGGNVIPSAARVAEIHRLAVLGWCLEVSINMLDSYIGAH